MKGSKEKVTMGSGKVYIDEFTGTLPEFETLLQTMKVKEKLIGYIKGGASVEYKPTMTTEKDDLGYVVKEVLTEEEAVFKSGVMTWNGETLQKLCSTARVTKTGKYRIVKIGGTANDDGKQYVILFVHEDPVEGNCYLVIVGRNSAGFTIQYATDAATVIDAEFGCKPQDEDGTLIQFVEEIEDEYQQTYTEEELNALTMEQIRTIATAKGYSISGSSKSDLIASFIAAQSAAVGA